MNYPSGTCGLITGTQIYESSAFMTNLNTMTGGGISTDLVNIIPGTVSTESFVGAAYGIDTTSFYSNGKGRMIEWFLEGTDRSCVLPNTWAYASANGNTACELDLESYTGGP